MKYYTNQKVKIKKIEEIQWTNWWKPKMREALDNFNSNPEESIHTVFSTRSNFTSEQAISYFLSGFVNKILGKL
jgi:hypothetical protein